MERKVIDLQIKKILKSSGFRIDEQLGDCFYKWSYEPIDSYDRMHLKIEINYSHKILELSISFNEIPTSVMNYCFDLSKEESLKNFEYFIKENKMKLSKNQSEYVIDELVVHKSIKVSDIIHYSQCELFKIWYFRSPYEKETKIEFNEEYASKHNQESLCIDLKPIKEDIRYYYGGVNLMLLNSRIDESTLVEMLDNSTNIHLLQFYESLEGEEDDYISNRRCINIVVSKEYEGE